VREEGVALEHRVHRAAVGRNVVHPPPSDDHVTGVGVLEPADDAQQRRLAAAARAEDRHELAGGHVEVDAPEGVDVSEAAPQPADRDRRLGVRRVVVRQPLTLDHAAFQSSSDWISPSRSSGGSA
jgi:hypothetical protein